MRDFIFAPIEPKWKKIEEPDWLAREIVFFDKNSSELVGTIEISGINTATLQRIFNEPSDEPMLNVWSIEVEHAEELMKHFEISFEFDKYDYQIGAYSKDMSVSQREGFMGQFAPPQSLEAS